MRPKPLLSLVIPVYNEQAGLPCLFAEVERACAHLDYEVVLVDDGSTDGSWGLIAEQGRRHPRFRGLRLSRNFGHQLALTAGLDAARGEAVVSLDADLQDPLDAALAMLGKWQEGYDVVYGVRVSRAGETRFKRLTAYLYYRLLSGLSRHPLPRDVGDFRLLSRRALRALRRCPERNRYLRGLVAWLGFPHACVFYHRQARRHGRTKFSLGRMLRFAATGLLSFSPAPLWLAPALGLALAGAGPLLLLYGLLSAGATAPGANAPTSLGALLTLFGACFLLLGVVGAYLGRIYDEVCRRPLYLLSATTDAAGGERRPRRRAGGPAANDAGGAPPARKARTVGAAGERAR